MPTILLIRHGEARGNTEGRFIGQHDVPLTERGRAQASALANALAGVPIVRVVSSDLQRCLDTVGPLAAALRLEVSPDPRLREIANGRWAGLLPAEIEARWPEEFRRYREGEDVRRPGGETWAAVSTRVGEALHELAAALDDGDVAVVGSHAGPIGAAARWAAGVAHTFRAPFTGVGNTSITTLRFPGPRLVGFNVEPEGRRASVGFAQQRREDG